MSQQTFTIDFPSSSALRSSGLQASEMSEGMFSGSNVLISGGTFNQGIARTQASISTCAFSSEFDDQKMTHPTC